MNEEQREKQDNAFKAVREFLESFGWKTIWELVNDFGQLIDPITGRTHDLDYAFMIQQFRLKPKE